MKKFLSFIISVIMLMTMTVPAFAVGTSPAATPTAVSTGTPTLYMTNSSAKAGQTLEMKVCVRDNPGIFAINIKLDFPKDVLEFVDATDGLMKVTGKNTSEASGDYGTILAESETTGVDVTGNGALFTVKFKIKDGATAQECTVGLNVISANNTALAYVTPATESGTASVTDRMVVSTVSGTATANYPPVYGNKAAKPTITVTEGAPAYFDIDYSNGYWYRRNADSTNTRLETDDTFTAGTYCFRCQIRIDGSSGTTYVLSKDGMTVSVNGTNWEVSSATIDDRFSYAWVRSPDFVVTAPVGEPLSFAESSFFNIGNSTARVAITPKNISTGATGGTSPYTFSKVSGPDWLNVSATGMISGTPTAAGTNEPLVVRVTDSVSATVEFSLSVGDTSMNPADRTVVSTVSGTATANYPPVYGNKAAKPTITVTEGAPAYFDIDYSNGYWYRKNADSTVTKLETGDTFTEGTYYFRCQIRIDGTSGTTHVLSKDGMTVSVNGVNWEVSSATIDDRFSYAWVSSPDFVVTAPGETNPAKPTINVTGTYTYTGSDITATVTGYDSATMNITGNVGKNAGEYTVSVTSKTGAWADGSTAAVTKTWNIAKANPTVTNPTGLTGTKGKALSTVTLPSGWAWKTPTTVMNTTGNQTFEAVYTPTDTTNYNTKEATLTVAVSEPPVVHPAKPTINVTGTYTYTGSDITATVTGYDSATMNITGNIGKNAGSYTVSVTSKTGKWADGSTAAVTKTWSIAKANPTVTNPTGLTGTKGKALSTVALPSGWAWKAPATVMNTTGNQTFAAVYTPTDTANYNTKEANLTVAVSEPPVVHPAKPTINVTGTYTYTGSDITATVTGYDSATMNITGNVGKNAGSYTVSVTSKTGQWADGSTTAVTKTWSIAKANPTVTNPTGLTGTKGKALSTVVLPSGWAWKAPATVMNTTGNQTFAAVYTPTDTANYNTKEANLTVAVSEPVPVITPVAVPVAKTGLVYNGSEQQGVADGTGYTLAGHKQTKAGSYTATATLKSGYKWADGTTAPKTILWSIARKAVTPVIEVTGTYTYTGSAINPTYTVKVDGAVLSADEYTTSVTENINAGNGKITVSDKANGNYAITTAVKAFVIGKGTQTKPTGIVGIAPTGTDASDGKITGVTTAMEYRKAGTTAWTKVTGTEITGLSAGSYEVRFAETENLSASEAVTVKVATHTHKFDESKWSSDANKHWYAASCGHDVRKDEADHNFDAGVITQAATETTEGEKTYTCGTCGYKKTEAIAKLEHTHKFDESKWSSDANKHWYAASCGHDVKKDEASHSFDAGVVTKAATEMAEGEKTYTCGVCGYKKTETIARLDHTHMFDESKWTSDEKTHWHAASCGHDVKKDEADHTFEWKTDREATASSKGQKHEECTICGYTKESVEIPVIAPTITAGSNAKWNKDSKNNLHFTSNANIDDFIAVLVDGETVAEENYEKKAGSIIIELKASYLETLSEGEHTLTIRSNGGDATAKFTVAKASTSPRTGSISLWIWIVLGVIALGGAGTAVYFVTKKKKQA